jgi:hypothetical protein
MKTKCQLCREEQGPDLQLQAQTYLNHLQALPNVSEGEIKIGLDLLRKLRDLPAESQEETTQLDIQQGKILNALKRGFSNEYLWENWAINNLNFIGERKLRNLLILGDRTYLHKYAKLGTNGLLELAERTRYAGPEAIENYLSRNLEF